MADNYPSLGIKADLADLVRLNSQIDRTEESMIRLGRSAKRVEEDLQASSRASANTAQQSAASRSASAERAAAAEAAALQRSAAAIREQMAFRDRLARQRAAEEAMVAREAQAGSREQQRAAEATMAFRVRMARQMAQEISAQSRAEREAVRAAEAAHRREAQETASFLRGLYRETARARVDAERQAAAARPGATFGSFYRGDGGRSTADVAGLGAAMGAVQSAGRNFMGFLGGLRNMLGEVRQAFFDVRTAVGILLAGMIISPIIRMTDAMTGLEARTRIYAERASDVPYTFEQIYRTAQDARVPLEAVGVLYTRLAPLAERLGKSQTDILRVAGTVSKSFSIGGATPAEAASSSQQLAQALGANRLGGDELRSLAENAPVLLLEISRSLNMNTGEFIKWAHSGKANTEVVVKAIEDAGPRIEAIFKTMPVTISQGMTVVGNAVQHLVGEVNSATGLSVEIAALLLQFSQFLDAKSTTDALVGSIRTLGEVFTFLGGAVQTVVAYTPSIIAFMAALGAAALLPRVFAAASVALTELTIATVYSGRAVTAWSMTLTASQQALVGLRAAAAATGATMMALLTPVNVLLAVVAGGVLIWNAYSNAERNAAKAGENLRDSQEGAINALSNALAFTEKYGVANDNLKKTLDGVITASRGAAGEAISGAGANDQAMDAARRRAEIERLLAVNILRRAAADATARGAEAQNAANIQRMAGEGARFSARWDPTLSRQEQAMTYGVAARQLRKSQDTAVTAKAEFDLAASLSRMQSEIAGAPLNVTAPVAEGSGGGSSPASADKGKGMSGAINAIAQMRAEVKALQDQVQALNADPLSDFAARIKAAGDEAAAARTAGKGQGFADEARALASQKEELNIRLELLRTSAQAERQAKNEAAQQSIVNAGRAAGAQIMSNFFARGAYGANEYEDALDRVSDAETMARISANNLAIAQRYGVQTLDQIAAAYARVTGASAEEAQAVQDAAIAEANAAAVSNGAANSHDKNARARDRLTAANKAAADQASRLAKLQRDAGLNSAERSVDAGMLIYKEQILADARLRNLKITEAEAEAQARVLALLDKRIETAASLKIETQDAISDGFAETGKLDLSPLKKNLSRSIWEAVYDSLLAEPIKIIVNATVDVVTQGVEQLMRQIAYALGGEEAGGSMWKGVELFFSEGGKFSTYMSKFGEAGNALAASVSSLSSILPQAIAVYQGGSIIGSSIAQMFGGNSKLGGQVGGLFGGIIGGIAGILDGKESNFGANATFSGLSYQIGGAKSTRETREAATGVAKSVLEMIGQLSGLGVNASGIIEKLQIGTRDTSKLYLSNGQVVQTPKGDAQALAEAAGKALIQYAQYQDPQMRALVDQMVAANTSLEDMVDKLDQYVQAQKVPKDLEVALLGYSNPRAAAMAQLQQQQLDRRRQISGYAQSGLYTPEQIASINATLAALEQAEIGDVVKRFADTLDGAVHSLQDYMDAQQRITDFSRSLLTSGLSPLSPSAQLSLDQSNFFQTVNRARGGDYNALNSVTDVAQSYLQRAQDYYGSTEAYAAIFQTVQDALAQLADQEFEDPLAGVIEQGIDDLEAAIEDAKLAIVQAITGAPPATPPVTPPPFSGGGDGLGGAVQDVLNDVVAQLQEGNRIAAAAAEAQTGVTANGLTKVADSLSESVEYNRLMNGGQVRAA